MPSRDSLIARIRGYIIDAASGREPYRVLTEKPTREAAQLAALTDTNSDLEAAYLLGMFHWFRYLALPDGLDQDDLNVSVQLLAAMFRINPESIPEPLRLLYERIYGQVETNDSVGGNETSSPAELFAAYQRTRNLDMLTEAIARFREAIATTPTDHPGRSADLSNLGGALQMLYERTRELSVLEEAVQVNRDAVVSTPITHPNRAVVLHNLGAVLLTEFQQTGEMQLLEEAAQALRDAVRSSNPDDPNRTRYLADAAEVLQILVERTSEIGVLEEIVPILREATADTNVDASERAMNLARLGTDLQMLFVRTGDTAVMEEAANALREGVAIIPPDHPERVAILVNFGTVLRSQFDCTGQPSLLEEAANALREALIVTPTGHPERRTVLVSLGAALRRLFLHTRQVPALDEAVQSLREAAACSPADHPERIELLNHLGNSLHMLFERTGQSSLLDEAAQVLHDALAASHAQHPDSDVLNNLGIALRELYQRTGKVALLEDALQVLHGAIDITPNGDLEQAMYLSNLGGTLQMLAIRTNQIATLEAAVSAFREAVSATSSSSRYQAMYLASLGGALQQLSQITNDAALLDEAVQVCRKAVRAGSTDDPERADILNNLGAVLAAQFEHTHQISILEEGVQILRDSVTAAPEGYSDGAHFLRNLGHALESLYEQTGEAAYHAEARQCYAQAAESMSAPGAVRLSAYQALASLLNRKGESPDEALTAMEAAIALLPQVAPASLNRADREYSIGQLASLAGEAAAVAVRAGRSDRAVELLETTRGLLAADIIDKRSSEIALLRVKRPDLAQELDQLQNRISSLDQLSTMRESDDSVMNGLDSSQAREDAYAAWGQVIERIRAVTGFEQFLQAPNIQQLASYTRAGPVVFIYATPSRCDALILSDSSPNPVSLVALTNLTQDDVNRQTARLLAAQAIARTGSIKSSTRIAAQNDILDILAWIWDTIAEPVLLALGLNFSYIDGQAWPRVWWCPIGLLAYLPIHAAGRYRERDDADASRSPLDRQPPSTVLDCVVSSYTTTVRTLAYSSTRQQEMSVSRTAIIAVPDPASAPPLLDVTVEASMLAELIPGADVLTRATRESVIAALRDHIVAHFACHAHVDLDNPAASQLILYDYDSSPLTVSDISLLDLSSGGLAYLSACATAATSPELTNEAIHITGAFQLAGYQHVIGTLWPVTDKSARSLAFNFYSHLTHQGTSQPDTSLAAQALHAATRRLRASYPATPTIWAAYTHTGI